MFDYGGELKLTCHKNCARYTSAIKNKLTNSPLMIISKLFVISDSAASMLFVEYLQINIRRATIIKNPINSSEYDAGWKYLTAIQRSTEPKARDNTPPIIDNFRLFVPDEL